MDLDQPETIRRWHEIVRTRDVGLLGDILADDCVFRSPAVHAPQPGKALTSAYLSAALAVLGPTLTYHRQWFCAGGGVLEFTCQLDSRQVHGVDMIAWRPDGLITDFTVMVRPMSALQVLVEHMGAELMRAHSVG